MAGNVPRQVEQAVRRACGVAGASGADRSRASVSRLRRPPRVGFEQRQAAVVLALLRELACVVTAAAKRRYHVGGDCGVGAHGASLRQL